MSRKSTPEDFWARVKPMPSGCWEWQGSTNSTGYGTLTYSGQHCTAHRLALHLTDQSIPIRSPVDKSCAGFALHSCDNRRCCNPAHLRLGTFSQNMLDAYERGGKKPFKGATHANSKLSKLQASLVRKYYKLGHTQVVLAKEFRVSQRAISLIVRGETYCEN